MPDVYPPGELDLAGFVVGVMDRAGIGVNGAPAAGDTLLGLPSTGLHTNGYSLARRALPPGTWGDFDPELSTTVGAALLNPHRSYLAEIEKLIGVGARGFAHITGGGLAENVARVVPLDLAAEIDTTTWEPLAIFRRIASEGSVHSGEMYRVFNMGIGLVGIVPAERVEEAIGAVPEAVVVGEIVPRGDDVAVHLLGLAA
jgi:phosphoribosylformylglycinamidine cyclo-ligase